LRVVLLLPEPLFWLIYPWNCSYNLYHAATIYDNQDPVRHLQWKKSIKSTLLIIVLFSLHLNWSKNVYRWQYKYKFIVLNKLHYVQKISDILFQTFNFRTLFISFQTNSRQKFCTLCWNTVKVNLCLDTKTQIRLKQRLWKW